MLNRAMTVGERTDLTARLATALHTEPSDALTTHVIEAWALVTGWLSEQDAAVPTEIIYSAVHTTALELHTRASSPGGVVGGYGNDGAGIVRLARDPLTPALPMLKPFTSPGIG